MRSNKLVSMDINELRGWAAFMDKAVIASLVATIVAVAALGITTWLSFRFGGAVHPHQQAGFDPYRGKEGQSVPPEPAVRPAPRRVRTRGQEDAAARARAGSWVLMR